MVIGRPIESDENCLILGHVSSPLITYQQIHRASPVALILGNHKSEPSLRVHTELAKAFCCNILVTQLLLWSNTLLSSSGIDPNSTP